MFVLVAVFIFLFGGAAIYAAYQTKQLKTELKETKAALEACEGMPSE
jgi:CHASE3 domain sensor protein